MMITPTELSRRCGITKQAVFQAIQEGLLPFQQSGKKKLLDPENEAVISYVKNSSRQREQVKKNDSENRADFVNKKPLKPIKPSNVKTKRNPKPANPSDNYKRNQHKKETPSDDELSNHDIQRRAKIAEMEKKEIIVEMMKKNLLPTEFIMDGLFRYLERLNSNIERSASVFISEVGSKILEDGEILPAHTEQFISLTLKAIHSTKKSIIKELENYEPKL